MTIDKISHLTIGKLNIKLIHNYQISANAELTVVIDVWSQVKLTKENICSYFYKTIRRFLKFFFVVAGKTDMNINLAKKNALHFEARFSLKL